MIARNCLISILSMWLMACGQKDVPDNVILQALQDRGPIVEQVLDNPDKFEVQILYTQIDRDSANRPHFTTHSYRIDNEVYFYPASTVKFPAAVLAIEKINTLDIEDLTIFTPMLTDSAYEGQTAAIMDTTAQSTNPTVGHYVKKILLVSDNDAFNRLYEFLGQKTLNQRMWSLGHAHTRLVHRLSVFLSQEQNRYTNPIGFLDGDREVYSQPLVYNESPIPMPASIPRGVGYMKNGELINEPMEFGSKNFFPLSDQQEFLKSVMFPNDVSDDAQLSLDEGSYQFLYQYMSQLPRETTWPQYDTEEYYDSYVKFFLFGDKKDPMPEHIRVFNKVGFAYGTLTDNAFIVDFENGIEFFLAATIFVNDNQIFNDNTYEYDEIGIPFLAELGRAIYELEQNRPKAVQPDLSRFRVQYDR